MSNGSEHYSKKNPIDRAEGLRVFETAFLAVEVHSGDVRWRETVVEIKAVSR